MRGCASEADEEGGTARALSGGTCERNSVRNVPPRDATLRAGARSGESEAGERPQRGIFDPKAARIRLSKGSEVIRARDRPVARIGMGHGVDLHPPAFLSLREEPLRKNYRSMMARLETASVTSITTGR